MSHFLSFSLSLPLCYSLKITNYEMRKNKIFYVWLLQPITSYWRRKKISSLEAITFLDTDPSIDNPYSQSSGIIIFLYKFYIVISYMLIESWMCAAREKIIIVSWETKKKRFCYRKKHIEFVWWPSLFWLHVFLLMSFFLHYSDFTRKRNRSRTWWRGHTVSNKHHIGVPNK